MKYSEATQGRIFIMRLEHGDILHETVERFAAEKEIRSAVVIVVGGVDGGSKLVVGPEDGDGRPVHPMERLLGAAHEVTGTGTLFPDESGAPVMHVHLSCGRGAMTSTGCTRRGVKTWQVLEVILIELLATGATRVMEPDLGFSLLRPDWGEKEG